MTVLVPGLPPDGKRRITGVGGLVIECFAVKPPVDTLYYQCEVTAGSWSDVEAEIWMRSSHVAEVNNVGASAVHFAKMNGVAHLGIAAIEWFDGGTRSMTTKTRIEVGKNHVAVFHFHIRNANARLEQHDITMTLVPGHGRPPAP